MGSIKIVIIFLFYYLVTFLKNGYIMYMIELSLINLNTYMR
jgi:hypothetical protein